MLIKRVVPKPGAPPEEDVTEVMADLNQGWAELYRATAEALALEPGTFELYFSSGADHRREDDEEMLQFSLNCSGGPSTVLCVPLPPTMGTLVGLHTAHCPPRERHAGEESRRGPARPIDCTDEPAPLVRDTPAKEAAEGRRDQSTARTSHEEEEDQTTARQARGITASRGALAL